MLDRALTLTGDGPGAKLDGGGSGTVLAISTSGATVTKLTIVNGDSGIALDAAPGNQLSELKISNVGRGIFCAWGRRPTRPRTPTWRTRASGSTWASTCVDHGF